MQIPIATVSVSNHLASFSFFTTLYKNKQPTATNTEGARTPESTVVEGNGPVKDSEGNVTGGSSGNVNNGSVIINNPEGSSGGGTGPNSSDSGSSSGSSSSEDFGRLLGSTRVVDDKAVVLIKNPKVNN